MRVLVVEDERRLAAGLRNGLAAEGFAVDVALDGTARPAGSTRVTWGRPEVGDRPPPGTDPYP